MQALDTDLAKAFARAARRVRKSPDQLLHDLVFEYLRGQEDYKAAARAHASIENGARTYSHAEVKKRLGLAG